jgi:CubicO group peptidase (beta-lactamase class C family)
MRIVRLVTAALALLLAPAVWAQESDALIGLWAAEAKFPSLSGELSVHRTGSQWTAAIAHERTRFTTTRNDIRFAFGERGSFRGRMSPDGRTIDGFWVQPPGKTRVYSFATPTTLRRTGANDWRGVARPLDERFTLYLSIFRDDKKRIVAAFRNPERNAIGGSSRYLVTRNGNALRFSVKYDGGEITHDATLLHSPERIRIQWEDLQNPIELSRRDPAAAAGFFPRAPGSPPYAYKRPPQIGDGWLTASAGELGIDQAALERTVREIIASDPTEQPATLIHSVLIAYRGRLVLEEYFFGYDRDTPHDLRSAGKTFSSVMLGSAMRDEVVLSPESRIYEVMKGLGPFANPDPRKHKITLAHLMTHSAGLACNDNDDNSPGNESRMDSQTQQPNWWKYTLDLPMAHEPGERYAYCSANINLVGGALTVGTETWLPELFERTVAKPLQFGSWHWNLMPNGEGYLGGGAFVRPRDLLKLGQAYLDGGTWNGRRIVDSDWVTRSTRLVMPITPETTGYSAEDFGNFYGGGADGLAWHQGNLDVGGRTVKGYSASGNGGQVLLVIPEYQLAAVFTGGNYRQGGVWGRWGQQIIGEKIIPAIRKP